MSEKEFLIGLKNRIERILKEKIYYSNVDEETFVLFERLNSYICYREQSLNYKRSNNE